MSHEPPAANSNGLRDAIITLPVWGITTIGLFSFGALAVSIWLIATTKDEIIKGAAAQLLVVLVPLVTAVVASVAVRRTSTAQIDRLINGFLEKTILERFEMWCRSPVQIFTETGYPFASVQLREPAQGRSYAFYILRWRGVQRQPVLVGIKTNVFNFEIFSEFDLHLAKASGTTLESESFALTQLQLELARKHPVLSHFFGLIQGCLNEGYEVKVDLERHAATSTHVTGRMKISLRQKVKENFLTSPFSKRYFAEDAAIAVGVLFAEYQKSGFMPPLIQPDGTS
jgi:hypothetical protein